MGPGARNSLWYKNERGCQGWIGDVQRWGQTRKARAQETKMDRKVGESKNDAPSQRRADEAEEEKGVRNGAVRVIWSCQGQSGQKNAMAPNRS